MARLTPPHALSLSLFLDDEGGGRDAECIFLIHNWLYLNSLTNNISVMQDASSSSCREGNTTGLNRATARALFQSLRASIPMSYNVRKGARPSSIRYHAELLFGHIQSLLPSTQVQSFFSQSRL